MMQLREFYKIYSLYDPQIGAISSSPTRLTGCFVLLPDLEAAEPEKSPVDAAGFDD
jgi:hypothetical protein